QAFHIDDFQPGLADAAADAHQMRQLAVRKDVAVDELAGTMPDRATVDVPGGDAVIHHQPARTYGVEQPLAVQRQVGVADVLEHADADDLVETAILRQIPVIHKLQGDLLLQSFGGHPFAGQFELFAAEGDAEYLRAELAGGIASQATP